MGRPKSIFKFDNVPQSWDEITLNKYQKIHKAYIENEKPNSIEILAIILDMEKEELEKMPATVVTNVYSRLTFLQDKIDDTPSDRIEIDNEIYKVNTEEELKFGEFVDFNTILDEDPYNYAAMIAILCRKENEPYNDDFIANKFKERVEMFNNQPITKIIKIITFFLLCSVISKSNMERYINQMVDMGNNILNNIESSIKSGDGNSYSTNLQKELETLRKQLNSI